MIGIGLGVAQIRGNGAADAPPPAPSVKYIRAKLASNQTFPGTIGTIGVDTVVTSNDWPFTGSPAGEFTVPAGVTKVMVNLTLMNASPQLSDGLVTLQVNGVAVTDILYDDQFWSPGQLRALLLVAPGDVIRIRFTPNFSTTLSADHVSISLAGYA